MVGFGVSPSSSFAVLLQVSMVDVVMPVLGVILVPERVGERFSKVLLVKTLAVSPSSSVTVAVHSTSSVGMAPTLHIKYRYQFSMADTDKKVHHQLFQLLRPVPIDLLMDLLIFTFCAPGSMDAL